jgi:hypothetical protein
MEKKKGLGYQGCQACNVIDPVRECTPCRLPEREAEKRSIIPQKKPREVPEGGGWRM